jgi:hypothetical protein
VGRNKISLEIWEQAKIAFASGSIGLRDLARKMNIPEGTMTARASRERWTQHIEAAKQAVSGEQAVAASPTVLQSVATTMQQRAERHVGRIAGVTESVLPHLESMQPAAILDSIHEIEKYDRMARRNFGLGDSDGAGGALSVRVLTQGAAIEVLADR